jgi:hypothetical protein|tara:strand:+ start:4422 stop:5156 length:735 start_codon:yes stop_codon:yes gene_type:complete
MIEKLLKKRTNITFFKKTEIPEKKVIEEILENAHNLTPHKNNFWHYEIDVYGPEHAEQKKLLALSTVTNKWQDYYKQENLLNEDWETLKKAYEDWFAYHDGDTTKSHIVNDRWHFNNQVTAPYLLVYYPAKVKVKPTQLEGKYFKNTRMINRSKFKSFEKVSDEEFNIQAGMHSMVTSLLSLEKGLDVSFCRCYFYNENIHTDILAKGFPPFMLGIGYRDPEMTKWNTNVDKPELSEVVKWQIK